VHPAVQRRGLGLQLLEHTRRLAIEQGMAYLGSSFGATAELVAFWRKAAYTPLAIGVRRDAASGAHGLLVLQGLDEVNIGLVEQQRQRFTEVLPSMLAEALQDVESDIVAGLLCGLSPHYVLQSRDRRDVQDFVSGARSYEHCTLGLQRAALDLLADKQRSRQLDTRQRDVLIARVLQRQGWAELARRSGLAGKAQLLECLRSALKEY
jgi:tRNA(Met) cytidine acetyltransferase